MNTTIFSVYDPGSKTYTYYRGLGDGATHAGAPKIRSNSDIGAVPELAAWQLPAGAMKVGSGVMPQGRIASLGGIGAFESGDGLKLGMLALAAYVAWKVLK